MTRHRSERCHFCGALLLYWDDRSESDILESEYRCDGCRMYELTFAYGTSEERVGFVAFQWCYRTERPRDQMNRAAAELKRATAHGDWAAVRRMPLWLVADWLGEHDCPEQEAAVRAWLAGRAAESVPVV